MITRLQQDGQRQCSDIIGLQPVEKEPHGAAQRRAAATNQSSSLIAGSVVGCRNIRSEPLDTSLGDPGDAGVVLLTRPLGLLDPIDRGQRDEKLLSPLWL